MGSKTLRSYSRSRISTGYKQRNTSLSKPQIIRSWLDYTHAFRPLAGWYGGWSYWEENKVGWRFIDWWFGFLGCFLWLNLWMAVIWCTTCRDREGYQRITQGGQWFSFSYWLADRQEDSDRWTVADAVTDRQSQMNSHRQTITDW